MELPDPAGERESAFSSWGTVLERDTATPVLAGGGARSVRARRLGRWLLVALLAAAVGGVVGVVAFGGGGSARASGWTRDGLRAVTQPVGVAGRFVVYVASGGGLRVVALDARTGATAWSNAASPSEVTPGEAAELALVDGAVIYIRPDTGGLSELAAADPATGRELWQTQPGYFTSWPYPCTGDPKNVCATGYLSVEPAQTVVLTFDGHTGALLPSASISAAGSGRQIGNGLFDPGQRKTEQTLVAASGSSVTWTRPLASIFTLPGASTDWGWNIDRVPRAGLFVGSVGFAPTVLTQSRYVNDLSRAMTAGFRISDGVTVWRDPGATYMCNELPCPGSVQAGFAGPATMNASGPTIGVSLSATGTATGSPNTVGETISPAAQITFEGFNPATGQILWRYNAGHDTALLGKGDLPPQVALNTVVLATAAHRLIILNLNTGSRHPASPDVPAWCRAPLLYTQHTPYPAANGRSITQYVGQFSLYPCTASGQRLATPKRVQSFLAAIGARSDGLTAWSENSDVIAARP